MTAQEFFKNDLFATNAGVELIEIREGYSKAKLEIKPEHLNAGQRTQGGPSLLWLTWHWQRQPIHTAHWPSPFLPTSPSYGPADGRHALCEARERYTGRSTGYYQIDVTDQEGRLIATFESSVFRKKDEVPFTL